MKFKLLDSFKPSKKFMDLLSDRDKQLLPFSIGGNFVFIVGFLGLCVSLSLKNEIVSGMISLIINVFFIASLFMLKKGKIYDGGFLGTIGILGSIVFILFFSPRYTDPLMFYRNACFIVTMAICNQVVSYKDKQIFAFSSGSTILWIVSCIYFFKELSSYDKIGTIAAIAINSFAIIASNIIVIFLNLFNKNLIRMNEEAHENAEKSLKSLTTMIEESRYGFEIGKRLHDSTREATKGAEELFNIFKALSKELSGLSDKTSIISKSSTDIKNQADKMKSGVQEQNSSITQTSAAMSEISANLGNMNDIAVKRRASMDELVSTLNSQMKLINELLNAVVNLEKSSEGIAAFVKTVDEIATQTGLLAMNASIEAAHAGSSGKGFAVIAQEIRKLSEGSSKNAAMISDELQKNSQVVKATSDAVNSFATFTKQSTEEMRSSVQGMEEILAGISEMNTGTKEVMTALQEVVDLSHTNGDIVDSVAKEIASEDEVLDNISKFSDELYVKMGGMNSYLEKIKNAIDAIEKEAAENVEFSEKITKSMS